MSGLKQVQHIVFDLDHTLWDFETNSKTALTQLYAELNLANYFPNFKDFHDTYLRINDHMWALYREGKLAKERLRVDRFRNTFKELGFQQNNLADELGERYVALSPHQTNLIEGSIDVLNYLNEKYELHILTNGFQEIQDIKLTKSGLKDFFDTITCSEEIGVNKPHVDIFHHVEQKIQVPKSELVMIGDNYQADILGAVNAGWHAIYFGEEANHDYQINRLNEIKDLL